MSNRVYNGLHSAYVLLAVAIGADAADAPIAKISVSKRKSRHRIQRRLRKCWICRL